MQFREFYYFSEAVQLLRMFWPEHDITRLGVYGWWEVYYVNKVPRVGDAPQFTNKRIKDSAQVKFFAQSPLYEGHRKAQAMAAQVCPEAGQKLATMGWPRQRSVLVLMEDKIPERNWITGGEIGGGAYQKKHGIRIPLEYFDSYILLHEHGHMMWFNMSKHGKELFKNWFSAQSKAGVENPDFYRRFPVELKDQHVRQIEAGFRNYVREISKEVLTKLNERRGATNKLYFDAHSAMKEGLNAYALKEVLFQRPNVEQPARLKRRTLFRGSGGTDFTAYPPQVVYVWRLEEGYKFRMRWYDAGRAMETPEMESWEMWDSVDFDIELLERPEQAKVEKTLEWCKKTLQGYYAPKADQAAFAQDLMESVRKWWPKIAPVKEDDGYVTGLPETDPAPAFNVADIQAAFGSALKAKKFKDFGSSYNAFWDLTELFSEVLREKFHPSNVGIMDGDRQQRGQAQQVLGYLGVPQGTDLRQFLAQRHGFPSAYGAANVDELWAETVAKAAQNPRTLDPGLRQVLVQAVTVR